MAQDSSVESMRVSENDEDSATNECTKTTHCDQTSAPPLKHNLRQTRQREQKDSSRGETTSTFSYQCIVCKKRFPTYSQMCRHRRMAHERPKALISREREKKAKPPPRDNDDSGEHDLNSRITFYAHISTNVAENLRFYLDGKDDALSNFHKHLRHYDRVRGFEILPEPESLELDLRKFNFTEEEIQKIEIERQDRKLGQQQRQQQQRLQAQQSTKHQEISFVTKSGDKHGTVPNVNDSFRPFSKDSQNAETPNDQTEAQTLMSDKKDPGISENEALGAVTVTCDSGDRGDVKALLESQEAGSATPTEEPKPAEVENLSLESADKTDFESNSGEELSDALFKTAPASAYSFGPRKDDVEISKRIDSATQPGNADGDKLKRVHDIHNLLDTPESETRNTSLTHSLGGSVSVNSDNVCTDHSHVTRSEADTQSQKNVDVPESEREKGLPQPSEVNTGTKENSPDQGSGQSSRTSYIESESSEETQQEERILTDASQLVEGSEGEVVQAVPDGAMQAITDCSKMAVPDGSVQAVPDGLVQAASDGSVQAVPDGSAQAVPDGSVQVIPDDLVQAVPDGSEQGDQPDSNGQKKSPLIHRCPVCKITFEMASEYINHLKDIHGIEFPPEEPLTVAPPVGEQDDTRHSQSRAKLSRNMEKIRSLRSFRRGQSQQSRQQRSAKEGEYEVSSVSRDTSFDQVSQWDQCVEQYGRYPVQRRYICLVCWQDFPDFDTIFEHEVADHPNIYCRHIMIEKAFECHVFKHVHKQSKQVATSYNMTAGLGGGGGGGGGMDTKSSSSSSSNTPGSLMLQKPRPATCTKCGKTFDKMADLHAHIIDDCAIRGSNGGTHVGASEGVVKTIEDKTKRRGIKHRIVNLQVVSSEVKKTPYVSKGIKEKRKDGGREKAGDRDIEKLKSKPQSVAISAAESGDKRKYVKNTNRWVKKTMKQQQRKNLAVLSTVKLKKKSQQQQLKAWKGSPFKCTYCSKDCGSPLMLRKHTGVCQSRLSKLAGAKTKESSTFEAARRCQYCGKSFVYQGSWYNHLNIYCKIKNAFLRDGKKRGGRQMSNSLGGGGKEVLSGVAAGKVGANKQKNVKKSKLAIGHHKPWRLRKDRRGDLIGSSRNTGVHSADPALSSETNPGKEVSDSATTLLSTSPPVAPHQDGKAMKPEKEPRSKVVVKVKAKVKPGTSMGSRLKNLEEERGPSKSRAGKPQKVIPATQTPSKVTTKGHSASGNTRSKNTANPETPSYRKTGKPTRSKNIQAKKNARSVTIDMVAKETVSKDTVSYVSSGKSPAEPRGSQGDDRISKLINTLRERIQGKKALPFISEETDSKDSTSQGVPPMDSHREKIPGSTGQISEPSTAKGSKPKKNATRKQIVKLKKGKGGIVTQDISIKPEDVTSVLKTVPQKRKIAIENKRSLKKIKTTGGKQDTKGRGHKSSKATGQKAVDIKNDPGPDRFKDIAAMTTQGTDNYKKAGLVPSSGTECGGKDIKKEVLKKAPKRKLPKNKEQGSAEKGTKKAKGTSQDRVDVCPPFDHVTHGGGAECDKEDGDDVDDDVPISQLMLRQGGLPLTANRPTDTPRSQQGSSGVQTPGEPSPTTSIKQTKKTRTKPPSKNPRTLSVSPPITTHLKVVKNAGRGGKARPAVRSTDDLIEDGQSRDSRISGDVGLLDTRLQDISTAEGKKGVVVTKSGEKKRGEIQGNAKPKQQSRVSSKTQGIRGKSLSGKFPKGKVTRKTIVKSRELNQIRHVKPGVGSEKKTVKAKLKGKVGAARAIDAHVQDGESSVAPLDVADQDKTGGHILPADVTTVPPLKGTGKDAEAFRKFLPLKKRKAFSPPSSDVD